MGLLVPVGLGWWQSEGRAKPGKLESGLCYYLQGIFTEFAQLSLQQTLWALFGFMGKSQRSDPGLKFHPPNCVASGKRLALSEPQ